MQQQVIFARMRDNHSPGFLPFELSKGELLPLHAAKSILENGGEYTLMKRDCIGIYHFNVPRNLCTIVMRTMKSKFNVGDIVRNINSNCVFRIYSTRWNDTDFWHQNGWGESQNFASGAMESDLVFATDEEIEKNAWSIRYYDELMEKRSRIFREAVRDSLVNE